MEIAAPSPISEAFLRDVYARMLLTRIVDDCTCKLCQQGRIGFVATCRGHEATQVGSAICIEVGEDFTLPYYRDLGVVLTIGMTPYEVFRTYLLAHRRQTDENEEVAHNKPAGAGDQPMLHWGYHKRNIVTNAAPVATQILHAAGIAFACKLRKASAVTVAYCGDGATAEPDFLEGMHFAAQHQLPVVFICEQDCSDAHISVLQALSLPEGFEYQCVDGTDVVMVNTAMQAAMRHAREGLGPVLLEMRVRRCLPGEADEETVNSDPLLRCQQLMREKGMWDEGWAEQLHERIEAEVGQALEDALRDVF